MLKTDTQQADVSSSSSSSSSSSENPFKAFLDACREGSKPLAEASYSADALLTARDAANNTALHLAASSGNTELLNFLLQKLKEDMTDDEAEARKNELLDAREDDDSATPFITAVIKGNLASAKYLFRATDLNWVGNDRARVLHAAAWSNSPKLIDWVVKKYTEGMTDNAAKKRKNELLDARGDSEGATPFITAVIEGNLASAKHLFRDNDLDWVGNDGARILHIAVRSNSTEMINWILEKLAEVKADDEAETRKKELLDTRRDSDGATPFITAVIEGNLASAKHLFRDNDLDWVGNDGARILHIAARSNSTEMINWILEKLAEVKADDEAETRKNELLDARRDSDSATPFTIAVIKGNLESAKHLFRQSDLDWVGSYGERILHTAALSNSTNMINWVLKQQTQGKTLGKAEAHKTKVLDARRDSDGATPFITAVTNGCFASAKHLFRESDLDWVGNTGTGIVHAAACSNSPQMIEWVLEQHTKGMIPGEAEAHKIKVLDAANQHAMPPFVMALIKQKFNSAAYLYRAIHLDWKNNIQENLFHLAVRFNAPKVINWILEKLAEFKADDKAETRKNELLDARRDGDGATPFIIAVIKGNLECAKHLFRESDLDWVGNDRARVVHAAACSNSTEMIDWVVKKYTEGMTDKAAKKRKNELLDARGDSEGATPFVAAVINGGLASAKHLFRDNDLDWVGNDGARMLHIAARSNSTEMINWILEKLAEVKADDEAETRKKELLDTRRDGDSATPFIIAVASGNLECAKHLFRATDLNWVGSYGERILHTAALSNSTKMINWLLKQQTKGMTVDEAKQRKIELLDTRRDIDGATPFITAVSNGCFASAKHLFRDTDLNWIVAPGITVCHGATASKSPDMVTFILEKLYEREGATSWPLYLRRAFLDRAYDPDRDKLFYRFKQTFHEDLCPPAAKDMLREILVNLAVHVDARIVFQNEALKQNVKAILNERDRFGLRLAEYWLFKDTFQEAQAVVSLSLRDEGEDSLKHLQQATSSEREAAMLRFLEHATSSELAKFLEVVPPRVMSNAPKVLKALVSNEAHLKVMTSNMPKLMNILVLLDGATLRANIDNIYQLLAPPIYDDTLTDMTANPDSDPAAQYSPMWFKATDITNAEEAIEGGMLRFNSVMNKYLSPFEQSVLCCQLGYVQWVPALLDTLDRKDPAQLMLAIKALASAVDEAYGKIPSDDNASLRRACLSQCLEYINIIESLGTQLARMPYVKGHYAEVASTHFYDSIAARLSHMTELKTKLIYSTLAYPTLTLASGLKRNPYHAVLFECANAEVELGHMSYWSTPLTATLINEGLKAPDALGVTAEAYMYLLGRESLLTTFKNLVDSSAASSDTAAPELTQNQLILLQDKLAAGYERLSAELRAEFASLHPELHEIVSERLKVRAANAEVKGKDEGTSELDPLECVLGGMSVLHVASQPRHEGGYESPEPSESRSAPQTKRRSTP